MDDTATFTPRFTECVDAPAKGSVCACKRAVVSKSVRAAMLHQWLVSQACICEEINAEYWWERYVASDSSPSHTQTHAYTIARTHAFTHAQWVNTALIWRGYLLQWLQSSSLVVSNASSARPLILAGTPADARRAQITASYSLSCLCDSDTWCMYGTKGGTCPSLQMVTRPTPNWLSSSWIVKGSGRR